MTPDLILDTNILSMSIEDVFIRVHQLSLRKMVQLTLLSKIHSDIVMLYLHYHPERVIEKDKKGKNILHHACKVNYTKLIYSIVFMAPCLLFIKDNYGKIPCDYVDSFILKNDLSNHNIVRTYSELTNFYHKTHTERIKKSKTKTRNPTPYPIGTTENTQKAFFSSPKEGDSYVSPVGTSIETSIYHPTPFDYENMSPSPERRNRLNTKVVNWLHKRRNNQLPSQ